MTENLDLLVERLHAVVEKLLDPAYCGHDPSTVLSNKCAANEILVAMYGGQEGNGATVPPAINPDRIGLYMVIKQPRYLGTITT